MTRTIIDINVLQTVPPSNLNRDDTGSPKTAMYGGVERARVSSQAWKRAARVDFQGTLDRSDLGMRTKRLVEVLAERITEQDAAIAEERALALAEKVLAIAGVKLKAPRAKKGEDAGPSESEYLYFLSNSQLGRLAELAVEASEADDAEALIKSRRPKSIMAEQNSIDISLFGRMVADHTDLNVDAAAQVAHAISVHAVANDFDYFTAVDDAKDSASGDDAGAAMIGTIEFNSSTLYRYATVDAERLRDNLGDAAAAQRAVEAFVRSFVTSMPTGKQNTFANRTLPDAVVVTLRDSQSVNLVGAFETPVGESERLARSSDALAAYGREVDAAFGTDPVQSWVVRIGESTVALDAFGPRVPFTQLVAELGEAVAQRLAE